MSNSVEFEQHHEKELHDWFFNLPKTERCAVMSYAWGIAALNTYWNAELEQGTYPTDFFTVIKHAKKQYEDLQLRATCADLERQAREGKGKMASVSEDGAAYNVR